MTRGSFTLVGGGARSGKSRFALALADAHEGTRAFVATAQAFDEEMSARIARHQAERAGTYRTVEAPLDLSDAFTQLSADVVVIDCLTLWLSNLLLRGDEEPQIDKAVERLCSVVARRRAHVVVVTNEVGLGIVPESKLGRTFRDVAGRAHQRLAQDADEVYFAVMGMVLRLKPAPVAAVH